jgi:hypothetical protein
MFEMQRARHVLGLLNRLLNGGRLVGHPVALASAADGLNQKRQQDERRDDVAIFDRLAVEVRRRRALALRLFLVRLGDE